MQPPKVTVWEKDLADLWKVIVLDQSPPKWLKQTSDNPPRLTTFSGEGLAWLKKALGDGLVWWLAQGTSPPFSYFLDADRLPHQNLNDPWPALQYSRRSLDALAVLVDPAAGVNRQAAIVTREPPTNGDLLIETVVGAWLREWQPARFAAMAEKLDPSAVALTSLLLFEPLPFALEGIVWDEGLLLCLAPRLVLAWENRWRRFNERLKLARTPGQIEEFGTLTSLFASYWSFARDRKRLDALTARLIRLSAITLTTMNASEAFYPEIDWHTMTVVDRQALKQRSHLAFALGVLMESQSRRAKKTGYLSDEYDRAQEVLKMFAIASDLPWAASLNSLRQAWSSDIAAATTQTPSAMLAPS